MFDFIYSGFLHFFIIIALIAAQLITIAFFAACIFFTVWMLKVAYRKARDMLTPPEPIHAIKAALND